MTIVDVQRWSSRIGLVLVLIVAAGGRATATDVTGCGQTVVDRDTGVLQADLVCSDDAWALVLGDRATLAFGGHTITGGGIYCDGKCSLIGPGTVQQVVGSGSLAAIYVEGPRFSAQDLTLTNNGTGIESYARKSILTNITASNNLQRGIVVYGSVRAVNVTTNNNGDTGLVSYLRSVRITGLTATGNGQGGFINNGTSTRLIDSTVTGNAFAPDPTMLDVFSVRRPRLVNTTCDHSLAPDGETWGICSGD